MAKKNKICTKVHNSPSVRLFQVHTPPDQTNLRPAPNRQNSRTCHSVPTPAPPVKMGSFSKTQPSPNFQLPKNHETCHAAKPRPTIRVHSCSFVALPKNPHNCRNLSR